MKHNGHEEEARASGEAPGSGDAESVRVVEEDDPHLVSFLAGYGQLDEVVASVVVKHVEWLVEHARGGEEHREVLHHVNDRVDLVSGGSTRG